MSLSKMLWCCALSLCAAPAFGQPANDACGTATAVGEGVFLFDNTGTLVDGPSTCDANMTGDVWYLYTPSVSGTAIIDTCATTPVQLLDDTTLIVYDAALGCPIAGSPCLASDDDGCGPIGFNSIVSIPVAVGSSYYLQVGGWNGSIGDGTLTITVAGPPANDLCAAATPVGEGAFPFNNTGAALDGPIDCLATVTGDVWFNYTATLSGNAVFDTCAGVGNPDTTLTVYDAALGCPVAGSPFIACNDDACGLLSTLATPVIAGASYIVQLGGWNGTIGAGTLTIAVVPAIVNDDCASAAGVGEGVFPINNVGAANDPPTTCDANMTGDLWFLYTPSAGGNAVIDTCATVGSLDDTTLIVYDAALGCPIAGGPCLASDDDSCGPIGFNSTVTVPVAAGGSYYLQVGGWNGSVGDGTLTVALLPGLPNDACATATPVSEGSFPFNNAGAASNGPTDCLATTTGDLWYLYTASATGAALINTCTGVGTLDDTTLIVYDAALGCPIAGSPCLASNDDFCGPIGFNSQVTVPVVVGSSYYVQVGGWNGTVGDATLTIAPDCGGIDPVTCLYDCSTDTVTINWTANANATVGYDILENGTLVGTAPAGSSSFVVAGPTPGANTYDVTWACVLGGSGTGGSCAANVVPPIVIPAGTTDLIIDNEIPDLVLSGPALELALTNNGRSVLRVTAPDFDVLFASGCFAMDQVDSIWCTFGTFPADYRISVGEGDLLSTLNSTNGIGVYFEGGDHWGFVHTPSAFDNRDGVNATGNTDGDDTFNGMLAQNPGFGPDMTAAFPAAQPYTQAAAGNDWTDRLVVAGGATPDSDVTQAGTIWVNDGVGEPPYVTGIHAEHAAGGNTMVQSWEFGGFPLVGQDALAAVYLEMLGRVGGGCPSPGPSQFSRGDCNKDGLFNIADPITGLGFLFPPPGGGPVVTCLDALDGNDDGLVNIADPVSLLAVLFPPPGPPPVVPPPHPGCGCDPTPDALDCVSFAPFCP